MLDYVVWFAGQLQILGARSGPDVEPWRRRVGNAYHALVNPMITGYGDPYPPDVPPAHSPGLWPDVASADIPGMTVRHQLVVVAMLADQSRTGVGIRARPELLADLDARIARARASLDHGSKRPLPQEARTRPSPELLAKAQAEQQAIREHARRRSRQVRDLLRTRPSGARTGSAPHSGKRQPSKPAVRPAAKGRRPGRVLRDKHVPRAASRAKRGRRGQAR